MDMFQVGNKNHRIKILLLIFLSQLFFQFPLFAATTAKEQGEEVYQTKKDQRVQHQDILENATNQSSPFLKSNNEPAPEEEQNLIDEKTRLKEFNKKKPSKKGAEKNSFSPTGPKNLAPQEINPGALKGPSGVIEVSPQSEDFSENEQEIKIEANKVVDVDEKTIEAKKYNGIIWFVVVFAILLIFVFAFT